jgi:hypothetical protein
MHLRLGVLGGLRGQAAEDPDSLRSPQMHACWLRIFPEPPTARSSSRTSQCPSTVPTGRAQRSPRASGTPSGCRGCRVWPQERVHQGLLGDGLHRGSEEDRRADPDHRRRPDRADRRLGASVVEARQGLDPEDLRRRRHGLADTHKDRLNADLLAFLNE